MGGIVYRFADRRTGRLGVDEHGRAWVDTTMRSVSHRDIFVVGDAARVHAPDIGQLRMACATAMPTAAHAAEAITALARSNRPAPFHPQRLRAFAAAPLQDPEKAADELERAVKDLGFVGRWSTATATSVTPTPRSTSMCAPTPAKPH
ncbi:amidohydrolase family protein [Mycobacterium pseudokansasii]|uniref:amidohydrolase family protein n=1 Tax=Mycobacterium pseudokansasii TaxID=2341080 RepID=UPI0023F1CE7B|nr:amidohydrolase family protein [Mycobacterium pseudokansasii]